MQARRAIVFIIFIHHIIIIALIYYRLPQKRNLEIAMYVASFVGMSYSSRTLIVLYYR